MLTIDAMSTEVVDSLPESLKELAVNFGADKIVELISKVGGRTYYVAEGKTEKGREKRNQLAEIVGVDIEAFINERYQGKEIYFPRMKKLETLARNNRIKAKADEMLGRGMSMKAIVAQLAKDFSLSERSLWTVLKQPLAPAGEGA
ncbi:Mor transcription activator family protein [Pseudomonas aeruginosa]